jgi:hypothetical protein
MGNRPVLLVVFLLLGVGFLQGQATTTAADELSAFAGTWKAEFHGRAFIILHLSAKEQKLVGSCSHSRSINWGRDGELTIVSDEMADDKVIEARLIQSRLVVKIANSESPEDIVTIELKLTGKDQAEGRLLNLPPDAPKLKPWVLKRS